jgi:hypothetical protein
VTAEYVIGTLAVGMVAAMFALYQRGVVASLAAKDAEILRIQVTCEADKLWLQAQLESWANIGKTAVSGLEKLTEKHP